LKKAGNEIADCVPFGNLSNDLQPQMKDTGKSRSSGEAAVKEERTQTESEVSKWVGIVLWERTRLTVEEDRYCRCLPKWYS
jgi:hypothetical protein